MSLILRNAHIVTPFRIINHSSLVIEQNRISAIGDESVRKIDNSRDTVLDLEGLYVVPGFVDLLVHGGAGYGFTDDSPEALDQLSRYFFSHGTVGLLAGLYSQEEAALSDDIRRIRQYVETHPDGNIWGIHLEGPFINPEFKGAMRGEWLWLPDVERWRRLYMAGGSAIKMMTIAPELPGAYEVMREAARMGVVLSIGHSGASFEQIDEAIDNGAAHVTHLFNAMKPFHHREPSLITASLLRTELKVELIADGFHVHPEVMQLLYHIKGEGGIVLITDSILAGGMPDGTYTFMNQEITVKDRKAFLPDGTLAGSTLTLEAAVRTMVKEVGVPITSAVRMASLNPVRVLGLEHRKGIVAVGKEADLAVLDSDFNVHLTIIQGSIVYRSPRFS